MDKLSAPKYIIPMTMTMTMTMIVSSCQHCDEQQFRTLSNVQYAIFDSSRKLDLLKRAQLRDHIFALKKIYAYVSLTSCCV